MLRVYARAFTTWQKFKLKATLKSWVCVKKSSTCLNLPPKAHTKPLNNINILALVHRQTVCRSCNPTIVRVSNMYNYREKEKARQWWWWYLGPVAPSPESWLPASLGVPADLAVGDICVWTKLNEEKEKTINNSSGKFSKMKLKFFVQSLTGTVRNLSSLKSSYMEQTATDNTKRAKKNWQCCSLLFLQNVTFCKEINQIKSHVSLLTV